MEKKPYQLPTITVSFEPQGKMEVMPRAKTVLQLMHRLNIRPCTCLFIRQGEDGNKELLTPDRNIMTNDHIIIRTVVSSG